jgi:hypothetical protein
MSTLDLTERRSEKGSDDVVKQTALVAGHTDVEAHTDPAFARTTLRKIDLYVLPILGVLYSFSLIDRVNIS